MVWLSNLGCGAGPPLGVSKKFSLGPSGFGWAHAHHLWSLLGLQGLGPLSGQPLLSQLLCSLNSVPLQQTSPGLFPWLRLGFTESAPKPQSLLSPRPGMATFPPSQHSTGQSHLQGQPGVGIRTHCKVGGLKEGRKMKGISCTLLHTLKCGTHIQIGFAHTPPL